MSSFQLQHPDAPIVIDELIDAFGDDRILWGSNYPVNDFGGYTTTVRTSVDALAHLPDKHLTSIFGGAARRLWPGLAGQPPVSVPSVSTSI